MISSSIMYDQRSNASAHLEKVSLGCLETIILISNIQNIGINHLFVTFIIYFTLSLKFICEFIVLFVVFYNSIV